MQHGFVGVPVSAAGVAWLIARLVGASHLTPHVARSARVNAEAVSPRQHVLERYWAWAGWIVPIVSLWFPYQVLRDIDRADKAVLDPARTTLSPAPVAAWWCCYLVYSIIPQVAGEGCQQPHNLGGGLPAAVRRRHGRVHPLPPAWCVRL
jgi:hypothetical protein